VGLSEFVARLAQDARPEVPGYQASWLYVLLCLLVPAVLGLSLGLVAMSIERALGGRSEP